MRQSVTYFVAAGLFALATALHILSQGLTLMTAIGLVLAGILVHLGLSSRRAGN
jgi:hypothetical protein